MMDYLQKALSGTDNSVSSRRLNTFISMIVGVIINFSIIVLAFKVALATTGNDHAISAIDKLINLSMIVQGIVLLMTGIITWQNINDSASIIKGLPTNAATFKQTIQTQTTELAKDIQNGGLQQ